MEKISVHGNVVRIPTDCAGTEAELVHATLPQLHAGSGVGEKSEGDECEGKEDDDNEAGVDDEIAADSGDDDAALEGTSDTD